MNSSTLEIYILLLQTIFYQDEFFVTKIKNFVFCLLINIIFQMLPNVLNSWKFQYILD